ncbi:hypothetical protein NBRC116595_24370 [Aliiglaciecola sp. NS0011-25]
MHLPFVAVNLDDLLNLNKELTNEKCFSILHLANIDRIGTGKRFKKFRTCEEIFGNL